MPLRRRRRPPLRRPHHRPTGGQQRPGQGAAGWAPPAPPWPELHLQQLHCSTLREQVQGGPHLLRLLLVEKPQQQPSRTRSQWDAAAARVQQEGGNGAPSCRQEE